MSNVGQREILTQQRVVAFFQDALGYNYFGDWKDRQDNANIEKALLTGWLKRQGHGEKIIGKALRELRNAAALGGSQTLYDANRKVYGLLRYGVKIKPNIGAQTVTVWPIDWANPGNNDFAIAEEVTVTGENTKRPDLVLYVNGIALGVLELKRSTVSVTEGIRQNLDSQEKGIHPAVLRDCAVRDGGQRHRRTALRHDRDSREVLAALEGSRGPPGCRQQPTASRIGPDLWKTPST